MLGVVELKVRIHCKACEKAVRKALCRIKGVRCVEIEVKLNKITVVGNVDRKDIMKALRKTGRRAEIWALCPPPPPPITPSPSRFRCILPTCRLGFSF